MVHAPLMQKPSEAPHGVLHAANSSRAAHGSPLFSPPPAAGAAVLVLDVLDVDALTHVPSALQVPEAPSVVVQAEPLGAGSMVHAPLRQKPSEAPHGVLHAANSSRAAHGSALSPPPAAGAAVLVLELVLLEVLGSLLDCAAATSHWMVTRSSTATATDKVAPSRGIATTCATDGTYANIRKGFKRPPQKKKQAELAATEESLLSVKKTRVPRNVQRPNTRVPPPVNEGEKGCARFSSQKS